MIFLSELLRQSIYDSDNRRIGSLRDVWVTLHETFPVVTALVVQHGLSGNVTSSNDKIIPWSQVKSIEEPKIQLTAPLEQVSNYTPQAGELLLKRDILDKQIVDTQGFRVVKVNDLKLAQIKHTARLVGADIGMGGLLRRLGIETPVERLSRIMRIHLDERTITWNYVEPLQMIESTSGNTGRLTPVAAGASATGTALVGSVPQLQLNVSHSKIAELRPADIADILEQLDVEDAGAMLDRLDTETAADTLNEVEYPMQSELLSELDPERASDLLERLAPDDAADILADIPHEEVERLLSLMPAQDAQPIRDLLRYGAQTAGGIMTTEVLALPQDATIEDALVYVRQHSEHLEMVYYLYVIDEEQHLMGVVSLRQLVTAKPDTKMRSLMNPDVIKVLVSDDQEEVANQISKYDLLAVPVVDTDSHLVGLVTVDDVIDVIHEEQAEDVSDIVGADVEEAEDEESFSWNTALNRFTWLGVNLIAGFLVALLLYRVFGSMLSLGTALASLTATLPNSGTRIALAGVICLIPMLLFTSGSAGSQSLGVAGWRLRQTRGRVFFDGIARELQLSTFGGILTSVLALGLSWLLFHSSLVSIATGIGFAVTLLIAAFGGLTLPNLFYRLRLRGSFVSAPLIDPIIAVISIAIFLGVSLLLVNVLPL